jgi:uroporphyrinogen-III synthase
VSAADLDGVAVCVLRVGSDPDAVGAELARHGAASTTVPVAIVEDRADESVRADTGPLERFAWVAVTSVNAARRLSLWSPWPAATRVAVVGPATRAAVDALGRRADAMAPGGTAVDLAASIDGGPVLFLAAATARGDLARALGDRGIEVTTVVAYDVTPRRLDHDEAAVVAGCDVLVAMAPSAIDALEGLDEPTRAAVRAIPLVAFGPSTEARADARHWPVAAVAAHRDPRAVLDAVRATLGR